MMLCISLIIGLACTLFTYVTCHDHESAWDFTPLDIIMFFFLTIFSPLAFVFACMAVVKLSTEDNAFTRWITRPIRKKNT